MHPLHTNTTRSPNRSATSLLRAVPEHTCSWGPWSVPWSRVFQVEAISWLGSFTTCWERPHYNAWNLFCWRNLQSLTQLSRVHQRTECCIQI